MATATLQKQKWKGITLKGEAAEKFKTALEHPSADLLIRRDAFLEESVRFYENTQIKKNAKGRVVVRMRGVGISK